MKLHWLSRRTVTEQRLDRFRRVLEAAGGSPEWTTALRAAGVGTTRLRRRVTRVEDVLERLPLSVPDGGLAFPRAKFVPPHGAVRVAQMGRWYPESSDCKVFRLGDGAGIEAFGAQTIVGPASVLGRMAEADDLPRVSHSLVALTGPGDGVLTETVRDRLWRAFGVPVYERWTGPDGAVIAGECAAHDGMHVEEGGAVVEWMSGRIVLTSLTALDPPSLRVNTGWTAEVVDGVCGCGRAGMRIAGLRPWRVERAVEQRVAMAAAG